MSDQQSCSTTEDIISSSASSNTVGVVLSPADLELAKRLLLKHPLKEYQRRKGWTPRKLEEANSPESLEKITAFFAMLCDLPYCYNRSAQSYTSCTCLSQLQHHELDLLSEYVLNFSLSPLDVRETVLKERIHLAGTLRAERRRNRHRERPPGYYSLGWEGGHLFCANSFRNLLGIFRVQWRRLVRHSSGENFVPGPISHGNVGNRNRHNSSRKKAAMASIRQFLQALSDQRGEPIAARHAPDASSVRSDELDLVELPSTVSKRKEYVRWCYGQGWIAPQATRKGSYGNVSSYKKREDKGWSSEDNLPVASWCTFLFVWKKYFPHLRVRSR